MICKQFSSQSVLILFCFHSSFHEAWFTIRRGVELSSVSTIRSLFARSDEPVSVISTTTLSHLQGSPQQSILFPEVYTIYGRINNGQTKNVAHDALAPRNRASAATKRMTSA